MATAFKSQSLVSAWAGNGKNNFPNGENYFSSLEGGYEKRISIIHAEPDWGAEWSPFLQADDFYDYFEISKELINYILIDRVM